MSILPRTGAMTITPTDQERAKLTAASPAAARSLAAAVVLDRLIEHTYATPPYITAHLAGDVISAVVLLTNPNDAELGDYCLRVVGNQSHRQEHALFVLEPSGELTVTEPPEPGYGLRQRRFAYETFARSGGAGRIEAMQRIE